MLRYVLSLFMLFWSFTFLFSQTLLSISGTIREKDGSDLPGAFVLLSKDTHRVMSTVTDVRGTYRLERIQPGAYTLHISVMGLQSYDTAIFITDKAITIPDIWLQPETKQVEEVVVQALRPAIEIKSDKIIVNVENSITAAGASIMDVLQTAPGVTLDANDHFALQGRPGTVVWLDGKPLPMQGTDLVTLLRSMPAGTVEKIELIARPGANYDAEGGAGIINIKTKRGKGQGWNSSVNLTYGQGKFPKYGAGINAGYRNRKWSVYGNYTFNYRYWFNRLMLDRRFLTTDQDGNTYPAFSYLQDNFSLLNFKNHIANIKVDYALSNRTKAGITLSGNSNRFEPRADNTAQAMDEAGRLLYNFNTTGRHRSAYYTYWANANMQHTFDSMGRTLSADLDYAVFTNRSQQNFVTNYTTPNGAPFLPDYFLKSDLDGVTTIQSLKSDYVHPVGTGSRLESGIKLSKVHADNKPLFYEKVNGNYELDTRRSNHFIYNEQITAAYANVHKDLKFGNLQLGMRLEHTYARWEQQTTGQQYDTGYLQLFPDASFSYPVAPKHLVSIHLNRSIERPNYEQLNPFRYFVDKTTYRSGDPYLQPASYYSVELSHIFNKQCITTFSYGINKGLIATVIQPSETEDSVTVQTVKNLDQMTFAGLSGAYAFSIAPWWNSVINTNIYYAGYTGTVAHTPLHAGGIAFDIKTNHTWMLPAQFAIEAGLFYKSKEKYAYMRVEPSWMLNIGVQKHLWNKRATLKMNIQDIFYKGYPRATSEYKDYSEDFIAQRETRVFNIALVYQLGKETMMNTGRFGGGAEEEKRRASVGNS